jgi:hypothetical protein
LRKIVSVINTYIQNINNKKPRKGKGKRTMITNTSIEDYFSSIQTAPKVGDLDNEICKITSVAEYKSTKSGKTSLKITFDKDGAEFGSYLGLGSEKAIDITNARLTKICAACVGPEEMMKMFKASYEDEDVENTRDLALDFAIKVNKKLKKNPVDAIVTRHKSEDGLWNVKWKLSDEDKEETADEQPSEKKEEDFYDALK